MPEVRTGEIPPYLADEAKFKDLVSQTFDLPNPEDKKAELALTKQRDLKDSKLRKKMGGKHASTAVIAAKLDT